MLEKRIEIQIKLLIKAILPNEYGEITPYILNIYGEKGIGKTFFIQQFQQKIDTKKYQCIHIELNDKIESLPNLFNIIKKKVVS